MENLPTLPGLDEPITPSSTSAPLPQKTSALAHQLAKNAVSHETKLLSDGKSRADVYGKLLPGYLAAKTGLSAAHCAEYCQARAASDAGESEGMELLARLLTV
jgi:hypothetical protein